MHPKILYKYFGVVDWLFPNPALRYSPPNILNDPYEITPSVDIQYTKKELKKLAIDNGIIISDDRLQELERTLPKEFQQNTISDFRNLHNVNNLGVLSLSSNPISAVMWGLYSSSQHGIVFAIDTTHDIFAPREGFTDFKPIKYSLHRPKATNNPCRSEISDWLFTKSKEWEFENEYRSITIKVNTLKESNGVIGTFALPPDAISAIYIGLRTEGHFLERTITFCKNNKIPYGRISHHPIEYKLVLPDV